MADDWRVTVDADDESIGGELLARFHEHELEQDALERLKGRIVVSRSGDRVFLYADGEDDAREALKVAGDLMAEHGLDGATLKLERWHPIEEVWHDADDALPGDEAARVAEAGRRLDREREESAEHGADWEVRIELESHHDTVALAQRLTDEGIPVLRRWRYVLVGAASEEDAQALVERLTAELPPGAQIHAEGTGPSIFRSTPTRRFAVFGGLAQ